MTTASESFLRTYGDRKAAIRALEPAVLIPKAQRRTTSIKDIRENGFLRLEGKTYRVVDISTYVETDDTFRKKTGFSWPELRLECLETGDTLWLEYEEDDDIEIYATTRALSFRELRDDEGGDLDGDDLDDLVDEEDSIFLGRKEFAYDDDYGALYKRGAKGRDQKGDKVYFGDFVAHDGECITIEEWSEGHDKYSYELFLSRKVSNRSIEILSLGNKS